MARAELVLAVLLLLAGLSGMLVFRNLLRKLIAMSLMQVAVIVFFISVGAKTGAHPPIVRPGDSAPKADAYVNPLPHALMLTAIVVAVSTTGVALALLVRIHRHYGTLDEAELLRRMRG
ncbi:MAG TPA: cation:proton antiporter subunit C [Vicinamibacteria bacterium]|nr:cation:proton antiporter subunit C [Vicinamibacteria bacterium]